MVRATFAGITTALSSLQANQKRLDIVGQNLSNMNTPGYTRQQLDVSSLNHLSPVSLYASNCEVNVGFGVKMDGVSRIRDPFLDVQYRDQIGKSSYYESIQTSLDTLADFLDEHTISGIRQNFDNIQATLTNMQNPATTTDVIYDSELRARMQALTNSLNDAARQIEKAEKKEYEYLDGTGTSENGAVQTVNELLKQIGELNVQIKRNQIVDQPSLELMDKRDMLLDELASYIPIEVTYYKDTKRDDWPYDLKVEMLYNEGVTTTNPDGSTTTTTTPKKVTLVNGSDIKDGKKNYGELKITGGSANDPTKTEITFTRAESATDNEPQVKIKAGADTSGDNNLATGSIQASLNMLGKTYSRQGNDTIRGFQYYMNELDDLANAFTTEINRINNSAVEYKGKGGELLDGTTAATIKIHPNWLAGDVKVGTATDGSATPSTNDTVLALSKAFEDKNIQFIDNNGDPKDLNGNNFSSFMNHISTILATDSYTNQQELKTNVTVLNGIQDSRDEISGVSLDEEASNMMAYLNAYNAASRLMTALDEALNTLINNTGLVGR